MTLENGPVGLLACVSANLEAFRRPALSGERGPAGRARYAVLEAGGVATWHEVVFDRAAFEAKVRGAGLPAAIQRRVLGGR